jgi:hypothetical protein
MSTYTTTREYDTTAAHAEEFYAIDYTLAYADQRELVERFADSLEYAVRYDQTSQYPSEMIHQIIDEWLTTGTYQIAEMWLRANCPQPDPNNMVMTITGQMVTALAELGHEWLSALLDTEDTLAGTMARLNTLWPVVFVEVTD